MTNHKQQDNQTIRELQAYIKKQDEIIERLSIDPSYGILTRAALEIDLAPREKEIRFVAFLDIDYLHDLNSRIGHDEANKKIRRALHLRASDVILSGKWYSGDEIVILLSGDPAAFCARLQEAFDQEGMSITIFFTPYSGKLLEDVEKAKKEVFRMKSERGSGR